MEIHKVSPSGWCGEEGYKDVFCLCHSDQLC